MKLPIVKVPQPILRAKAKPVKKITPDLLKLAQNMIETMDANRGIGLAAPQVGQSIRLLVAGFTEVKQSEREENVPRTILFNPKIIDRSESTNKLSEGCLSIPGLTGVVERASAVSVNGMNEAGQQVTIAAQDLHARVLQHEIDHLDGVLFTDRLEHYKVIFFGTSEFAVPALERLILHPQFEVVAVVTETDKPAGRGHNVTASPIKKLAQQHKIPVLQPATLKQDHKDPEKAKQAQETLASLQKLRPHFFVVASYGKILPEGLLHIPSIISLNIHPSLLPKYRGPSPIQSALLNGDTETGICIMEVAPAMDAGDILTMYKHPIYPQDSYGSVSTRLADAGAAQLILTLEEIIADKAEMYHQDHTEATFTKKFEPSDAKINWSKPAATVVNHIRAFSPKPGAWTDVDDLIIKIISAHLLDDHVVIDQVLIPGKKLMTLNDLKNGYKDLYFHLMKLAAK